MSFYNAAPLTGQSTAATTQNRPLVLNEGQMFHGQIKQLFPGQMAEVQIGGQKLVAKLEVPMKAGDSYYFQVNAVKPELQLKIISGPLQATEGQSRQLGALMDAMQLPKTPEMQSLLAFVMKNRIPMTREGLLDSESLLKNIPATLRNEALASIQKLAELKLPFTESLFRSLLGVETKEGLHAVLATLRSALTADPTVSQQQRDALLTALDKMVKPFAQATGGALLGQSLLALLDNAERPETRFATLQLLKSAGILPERASLANLQQMVTALLTSDGTLRSGNATILAQPVDQMSQQVNASNMEVNKQNVQTTQTHSGFAQTVQGMVTVLRQLGNAPQTQMTATLANLQALITADSEMNVQQKSALMMIVDRAASAHPATESPTKFVQEFSQSLIKITAENAVTSPFQTNVTSQGTNPNDVLLRLLGQQLPQQGAEKLVSLLQSAERSDNTAIQKMLQAAEMTVASAVDGKALKEALQTVFRTLGLNYEAGLLGKESDVGRLMETVKPQLLALLQDPAISPALRVAAETVVMRMNGPLLQSGENGVQHQLVMQVPLEFFGKRIDTTLQWNGRMKEDGKIDPDFARILFYLDLESIDKTVIDMQVQNRVVTVTVFNEDETLKFVGAPLQNKLKEGLKSAGYKLSGVFFKTFMEEEKSLPKQSKLLKSDSRGVDFRI